MINQQKAQALIRSIERLTAKYNTQVQIQTTALAREVDAILVETVKKKLKKKDV